MYSNHNCFPPSLLLRPRIEYIDIMNVTIVGAGYVGLVSGACLAKSGHTVHTIDINEEKIALLNDGISPIFEPQLEELIKANKESKKLFFSTDLSTAVKSSDIILICVNTPPDREGKADLTYLKSAIENLSPQLDNTKVVVLKSTVPVGTAKWVEVFFRTKFKLETPIVSNPEFLRQGSAVHDFLFPDRVILGGKSKWALDLAEELHHPFLPKECKVIRTDHTTAELIKYAANAFLAAKISFINYFSLLAEQVGANVKDIQAGVAADPRIGPHMLYPGIGFGGSCLPKDLAALIQCAKSNDIESDFLESIANINKKVKMRFAQKVNEVFKGDLENKNIAIWGLSFKPKTDDIREAPSIDIINFLIKHKASITTFDPQASKHIEDIFGGKIKYAPNQYEALNNADALLILTEWEEFQFPSFTKIRKLMKLPRIFDGRNIYDAERVKNLGFEYYAIGLGSQG